MVLLQGENRGKLIKEYLIKKGFDICVVECYKRIFKIIDIFSEVKNWRNSKINTLVVTSGEILYRLDKIISIIDKTEWLFKCKIFFVGNRLADIAKKIGWSDIIIFDYADNNNLFKLINRVNNRN
ncbi:uroporphyrinogen-III synthase [Buchnera aphidicola]|uniref:uroporphyrinogen-III synthase n=1 Tax=Buchnera aphidicola TaxID=9 RepID=UPI000D58ED05|nr:uroporphyrinogen-III synthase [Buchnera aphidicola]AWI49937.1 uroporphyrinogen-III synthase [Buchnera aphidicola (Schizaphis graminum)]